MDKHQLAVTAVELLRRYYPDAVCTLDFKEPWQLLVAAILSAQCTDERVNRITPGLFARFPDLPELALASRHEIEELIRSCGLYRAKANSISASARILIDNHDGSVPGNRGELMRLPGVGRKIANLILGDCFGQPAIVVDTHCARISRLIGLTDRTEPLAIERDLAEVLPEADWIDYGHLMVRHGRAICLARRPACPQCPLQAICRFARQV